MYNYMVLKNLNVQNANALSFPFMIGIPQMPAFLGAIHKLQRDYNSIYDHGFLCNRMAVSIHDHELKILKNNTPYRRRYTSKSKLKKNAIDQHPFKPEAYINLYISILLEYSADDELDLNAIENLVRTNRIAGGTVTNHSIKISHPKDDYEAKKELMYGYVLKPRMDLINNDDSFTDLLKNNISHYKSYNKQLGDKEEVGYNLISNKGWIVPISTGYMSLSGELDKLSHTRTYENYKHAVVESVTSFGEYVLPLREDLNTILWKQVYKEINGNYFYLCIAGDENE